MLKTLSVYVIVNFYSKIINENHKQIFINNILYYKNIILKFAMNF